MCNQITKIAKQNEYQWIGICRHGSGQVFWRTSHVCVNAEQLEDLMNRALAKKLPVEVYGDHCLLWLNNVAIRLTKAGYQEIQDLFAYAAKTSRAQLLGVETSLDSGSIVLH